MLLQDAHQNAMHSVLMPLMIVKAGAFLQACTWTGNAKCTDASCQRRCIANLWPAAVMLPMLSGVAYQNDAYYGLCPALASHVENVRIGNYSVGAQSSASIDRLSGRSLLHTSSIGRHVFQEVRCRQLASSFPCRSC